MLFSQQSSHIAYSDVTRKNKDTVNIVQTPKCLFVLQMQYSNSHAVMLHLTPRSINNVNNLTSTAVQSSLQQLHVMSFLCHALPLSLAPSWSVLGAPDIASRCSVHYEVTSGTAPMRPRQMLSRGSNFINSCS